MDFKAILGDKDEKPLDRIPDDGGFASIFRTIGCIGDSLSSGEFESLDDEGKRGYHDYYEYSWGQYMARQLGSKVYNFSRGGMTAREYWESFAQNNGFWDEDKKCQAYIIALGVNDIKYANPECGSMADIDREDYNKNAPTFAGYYAKIIQRLKTMQPRAKFFLMTMPRESEGELSPKVAVHQKLLYEMADYFDNTYVLDFAKYAPIYDAEYNHNFRLGGHLNPMGYIMTAKMTSAYIDYIIRHNMKDFTQVGFIGTPYSYKESK